jgi:hypothetical protein
MRRTALAVSVLAAMLSAPAWAGSSCNLSVQADIKVERNAWVFGATDDRPEVRLAGNRLWIGGRAAELTAEDQRRVAGIASEFDALGPEVQAIAVEAVDIAFTALEEVAIAFNSEAEMRPKMAEARSQLMTSIRSNPAWLLDEQKADDLVGPAVETIVAELVPTITGAAVSQALKLAFSGDEAAAKAFEVRMENMETQMERRVEARAKALEPKAEAVCRRLERIEALDNDLEVRDADGDVLNLIVVRRSENRTASR